MGALRTPSDNCNVIFDEDADTQEADPGPDSLGAQAGARASLPPNLLRHAGARHARGRGLELYPLRPIRALFISAVINGVVAPPPLLLIVLLRADRFVMKHYVSGKLSPTLIGITIALRALAAIGMFLTS